MNDSIPFPTSLQTPISPSKDARQLQPPIVEDVLAPIEGGDENLLPVSVLNEPLNVKFPLWGGSNPGPQHPETLQLLWNGAVVGERTWDAPIAEDDRYILLPREQLLEGIHELGYQVRNWMGNDERSELMILTIDRTPPGGWNVTLPKLKFSTAAVNGGITRRYLDQNNNQATATVPPYGYKPGDRLKGYWDTTRLGVNQVLDIQLAPDLSVSFDGDMIELEGNGDRFVTYVLQDYAGNVSLLSLEQKLIVNLAPPVLRDPPSVDKVTGEDNYNGTLAPANATSGVTVKVPVPDDDISDTILTAHWKGYGEQGSFQTSTPVPGKPLEFKVPPSAIPANMGRTVEVWYSLEWPDGEPENSAVYNVKVQMLTGMQTPLITCQQSVDRKLSLSALSESGANLSLPPWAFKAVTQGMRINLWVDGEDHQGRPISREVLKEQTVPMDNTPVVAMLKKSVLQELRINGVFAIRVAVSFDDGETYLNFRQLDLTLIA